MWKDEQRPGSSSRLVPYVRRTPVRSLVGQGYALAIGAGMLVLSISLGVVVYYFLWFSAAAQLGMHVEAAWFHALPALRPPLSQGRIHHHRFGLESPPNLAQMAQQLSNDIASHPLFVARILTVDGHVLGQSERAERMPMWDPQTLDELLASRNLDGFPPTSWFTYKSTRWLMLVIPVIHNGKVVAVVQSAMCWWMQRDVLHRLIVCLTVCALVSVLLGIRISYILSRLLVGPLEKMVQTTGRIARGDLTARTGLERGTNEIFAVAGSLDEMADRVQASFEVQRRFIADASHELRTPLTAISGMVDLLDLGADTDAQKRSVVLETMMREVNRMNELVADLLRLSRAEEQQPAARPVNISPLVTQLVEEQRLLHPDRAIDSSLNVPVWALMEEEAVRRVIGNLITNAVKYTSVSGHIDVSHSVDANTVTISVHDNGIGISEDDLPHVFDRFYRADRSRARTTGGAGLGLAIARAMVESYGGEIRITSEKGHGTMVTVVLRAAIPPD